jgi:hypothetical protein
VTQVQHVISEDGTRIAYEKTGQGPAVIIVGGALGDHQFYLPLAHELAQLFTVYNFDRRGRGQSGDTQPYSVEREVEDVGALIADAGEPVCVYGHSAGSALAVRSAAAGLSIAKLALADPPYGRHSDNDDAARARFARAAARIQALHDDGDHKGAAAFFLSGFGLPPEAVEDMLQAPGGDTMIDCARALPYEYAMLGDGLVPNALAAAVATPTIILAAETAPATAKAFATFMPSATLQLMKSSAHDLAPTDIASVITPFLSQQNLARGQEP